MSELTEDQKLVKLGLRSPNQTESAGVGIIAALQENIAKEWDTFQENFEDDDAGSWSGFEIWLQDNGIANETSANIRSRLESKYDSFAEFKDLLLNDWVAWADFENAFASNTGIRSDRTVEKNTEITLSAGGIKVYEEDGVGRSGQQIPAGGVEIFGSEVHFSQSGAVQPTPDESAGVENPIVWDNLSVSPTGVAVGDSVYVEADVTNNTTFEQTVVAELIVNNDVRKADSVDLGGGDTRTVEFEYIAFDGSGTFDIGISKAGTDEVQVIYGGL